MIGGIGPATVGIGGLGIDVASFLFSLGIMISVAKELVWISGSFGCLKARAALFMVEGCFEVALPGRPLKARLGLG